MSRDITFILRARNEAAQAAKAFVADMRAAGVSTTQLKESAVQASRATGTVAEQAKEASKGARELSDQMRRAGTDAGTLGAKMRGAAGSTDDVVTAARDAADAVDGVASNTDDAADNMDDLAKQTERTSKSMNTMKLAAKALGGILGTLFAGFSAKAFIETADAWSDMQSRIGAAVGDMNAAPELMQRMVSLANASYSSLDQTVEVYARNVAVMKELGYTANETADFTEALNNALVITATRGERAASVQAALSKAMALGKLDGEGLETVLNNGGRVARALADALNTTTSGLRELATEGKITGSVIAGALIGSFDQLKQEAAEMPATVGDGLVRIQTGMTALIGTFDKAFGISGKLAETLVAVGDALQAMSQTDFTGWADNLGGAMNTLGTALAILAATQVPGLVLALRAALVPALTLATNGMLLMHAQFIAGAILARAYGLAVGAAAVAGGALGRAVAFLGGPLGILAGLVAAGTIAWTNFKNAMAEYKTMAMATAEAQDVLNLALQEFGESRNLDTARALREAAEDAVKKFEAQLQAAQAFLDSVAGITLRIVDPAKYNEVVQAIELGKGKLMEMRSIADAASVAEQNLAASVGTAKDALFAQSTAISEIGNQTLAAIPSLDALRSQYGFLAEQVRQTMIAQNELATYNQTLQLGADISGIQAMVSALGTASPMAAELASRLKDVQASANFADQANQLRAMAEQMLVTAGGLSGMSAEGLKVYAALLNSANAAAALSGQTQQALGWVNAVAQAATTAFTNLVNASEGGRRLGNALVGVLNVANAVVGALGRVAGALGSVAARLGVLNAIPSGIKQMAGSLGSAVGSLLDRSGLSALGNRLSGIKTTMNEIVAKANAEATQKAIAAAFTPVSVGSTGAGAGAGGGGGGGGASPEQTTNPIEEKAMLMDSLLGKYNQEIALAGFAGRELELQKVTFEAINAAKAKGLELSNEELGLIRETANRALDITRAREMVQGYSDLLQTSLASGIKGALDSGRLDMNAFISDLGKKLRDMAIDNFVKILFQGGNGGGGGITNWLMKAFGGGGGGGGGGGFLGKLLGFAEGGIMTKHGKVPLKKYQTGGIAYGPQMAMFGEGSVPEAYVPVPSGKIPVEMRGATGNSTTNTFQFNISTPDADSFRKSQPQILANAARQLSRQSSRNN